MAVNVAIIGLGQIGTSMGLALAAHTDKVRRIGHDIAPEVIQQAKKMGAVDSVQYNLPSLAAEADVVILCLPFDQVKETLEIIAPDLREDVVVIDTSPIKAPVADWFKQLVPGKRHYVGLVPSIAPGYLAESVRGAEAARADLFQRAVIGIVAPAGTPEGAVTLASNLAQLVGGVPLFMDLAEADGLMTSVHILPQLVSASLINALVDQPGWKESRKLAGKPFMSGQGMYDTGAALSQLALLNPENTVRLLDLAIAALQGLREAVSKNEAERVAFRMDAAAKNFAAWQADRLQADWVGEDLGRPDTSQIGGLFQRMFGFGGSDKKKK